MLQGRELAHKTRGGTWNMWPNLLITCIPSSPHLLCALTGSMYQQIQSHKDPLCPSILNFTNYKWVSMIVWSVCFILYINNTSQIFFFLQVWGDQLQWLITFQKSVKEIHKFINAYRCFPELGFFHSFQNFEIFYYISQFPVWCMVAGFLCFFTDLNLRKFEFLCVYNFVACCFHAG